MGRGLPGCAEHAGWLSIPHLTVMRYREEYNMIYGTNPLTKMDYPDPDIIRVGDTYYIVSTTMYFMPGAVLLRSYDLINWEICSYIYESLEHTPGERLEGEQTVYSHGMWAPCIRYHNCRFYVVFIAHEFEKTFLFTAEKAEGPWTKSYIEGIYHDPSLLFDDDGRVYIVYDGRDIKITELKKDLSGPEPGGLHKTIVRDAPGKFLGYEGSHIYKINGKYLLFLIHSNKKKWFRTQACFMADSLEDSVWSGGDVLMEDLDQINHGVAQGGIVDTPDGRWFAVLFQDHGAVGRIPVLVPIEFNEYGYPVFGDVTKQIENTSTRPDHKYEQLYSSDEFDYQPDEHGKIALKKVWQFNHEPVSSYWGIENNSYWIVTDKLSRTVEFARNTLTQRTVLPYCSAEITLDARQMKIGDVAGICALIGCYSLIGIAKGQDGNYLVMKARRQGETEEKEYARIPLKSWKVRLKVAVDFTDLRDEAQFFWLHDGKWEKIGVTHPMQYTMDHFTGCRFGLFMYSTEATGGKAAFSNFIYHCPDGTENQIRS